MSMRLEDYRGEGILGTWTQFEDAEVYVRNSRRYGRSMESLDRFLDLANFARESRRENVKYDPNATSTGFMRRLLTTADKVAREFGADGVYVEAVMNEWLPEWLESQGFTQSPLREWPPCYYRYLEEK